MQCQSLLNSNFSPINVDAIGDNIYQYLKFEYNSYMSMEMQLKEIIAPIGYTQNISQDCFLFAFLTLSKVINSIKDIPLEKKVYICYQLNQRY